MQRLVGLLVRAGQKDATVSLSDRHVPVPIGVSKVPEASGFVRGVAELGVVTVLGATFHEVNPVARGRLNLSMRGKPPHSLHRFKRLMGRFQGVAAILRF